MARSRSNTAANRQCACVGPSTLCLVLGMLTWVTPEAYCQETPTSTGQRVFHSPGGVRIDISTDRDNLPDEETLAALEEAARQTRERIKQRAGPDALPADAGAPDGGIAADLRPGATSGPQALETAFPVQRRFVGLPPNLLWEPQMANPLQPRMYLDGTSLDNENTHNTVDTAIGGEAALVRVLPRAVPGLMVQEDFFAVVLSRWASYREAVASDYRFGFPTTFSYGNWQGKLGFEHTSTHLGDDFIKMHNRFKDGHIHDEVVAGLAYRFWNQVRVYGVLGLAPADSGGANGNGDRYNVGVEWSNARTTGWQGQPFAACDLELRADQDYQANVTTQAGWQWQRRECDCRATSFRIGLQYYDGKSPFGQFFRDRERFLGAGLWVDF
jgi:hypothetical protein